VSPTRPVAAGRDPEYDRFGPWVVRISPDDPLPPLFAGAVPDAQDALMSIKVPRRISRREARPGMDLYDYVLVLREAGVQIHERVGRSVRTRTIDYGEIHQLSLSEQLLRGELRLGLRGEDRALPYNTVSKNLMREVAVLIRRRYLSPTVQPSALPPSAPSAVLSFYFERLLDEELADGKSRALAAQETVVAGALGREGLRRWLDRASGRRLLESLHVCDGTELRFIDRGYAYAYRWQAVYGRRETFMPVANVRGVDWDVTGDGSAMLTVRSDGGEGRWAFSGDLGRLEPYLGWLRRLT
jgi:hypothetical protein